MDNMGNMDNGFNRLKQHSPAFSLGDDFEVRVFAKIKRKKRQRKIAASAAAGVLLAGFVILTQTVFFNTGAPRQEKYFASGPVNRVESDYRTPERIESPVMGDVVFASSDSRTSYAISHVTYNSEDDSSI